jgi:CBS domain-containing protein
MTDRVVRLFKETTLGDVLAFRSTITPRELVTVGYEASMHDCLRAMIDNKVSAIPVLDEYSKVVGIVDMTDVCRTLIEGLSEAEGWKTWPDYKFSELLGEIPVTDGVDFAKGDPLLVTSSESSVKSIMKFFSSGLAHRCVIRYEGDMKGFGIVSQVDVASWIASKIDEDEELRQAFLDIPLLSELQNRSSESHHIVQALWTDSVFDILKLMMKEQVRAVGLVDEQGKLQGNFSASDLVHLDDGSVADIRLTGKEYLKKYSSWSLTPVSFLDNESANLGEALMMFSAIGIHRVWLVNSPMYEKFQPTGVMTVTDVLHIAQKHFFS